MSRLKPYLFSVVITAGFFVLVEGFLYTTGFKYTPREKIYWRPMITMFEGTRQRNIETRFDYPGYIWRTIPNTPYTDSRGFRRPEVADEKPPGTIRIAFLGGSTTHGGYRPYPERVVALLNDALGEDRYEALNAACSSYSTLQSRVALERWVLPLDPDMVFVYHGWNDPQVQHDGYGDHEKYRTSDQTRTSWLLALARVRSLRIGQAMAGLLDWADYTWPRPRVTPDEFRANLDDIARQCDRAGVPLWVATRPRTRRLNTARSLYGTKPLERQYYSTLTRSTDAAAVYGEIHRLYTDIQRDVALRHANAQLCDLSTLIDDLQQRQLADRLGPHLTIFREDDCHLYEFAEQQMAQYIALTVAPQHRKAVVRHIDSYAYNAATARLMLAEEQPGGALFYAARAAVAEPSRAHELADLMYAAERNVRFVELFHQGRPGTKGDFADKLAKLKTCLALRPDDFGVVWQIYRLCVHADQVDQVAEVLAEFRPDNPEDTRQWLSISLESHIIGERLNPAFRTANQLLRVDPDNKQANAFLAHVRQVFESQGTAPQEPTN